MTIWNPSDSDVTLEIDGVLADLEGGNQKGKMIITVPTVKNSRYVVTIAAQSEGTFVVTPTMVEGEDEADKYATGKITLTGLAVEETAITLRMTQSKDNARFVVPAMGVSDIGSAEVGKEFSYQFELAKDKNVAPNVTWEIVANAVQGDDTLIDGNMAEGELTAEDLATYYGISIDENTGLLSAAPVVRLSEEGDVLNAYNMYTYTNEKEIANRVVGAGKLLPLDHKYTFWVKATYYVGDNATPNYIYKKIELTIAKPTSALELGNGVVTMNDYDNPENNKLDMGSIGLDSGTGKSEVVNVKNVTNVDVNNVKVEIVGVKRYEEGRLKEVVDDWSEMFTIVYDDNATLQANGVKFGLNVNAKGSTPFTIKSLPSTGAAGQLKAGEYEVQIRLHNVADNVAGHEAIMDFNMNKLGSASFFGNDDLNDTNDVKNGFFFTATLNVVDAPIIEARKNTIATEENVDRIKVGYKLAATGTESVANGFLVNRGFTARLANDTDTQFDLTMTDAPGSTTKIAESGIWMDKDGAFTTSGNKVLKAGVYNIVITAVSRTDGDNGQTRGEREFTLVIYGDDKAAFQVKAVNDQTVLTADHTWMLPGQIAGGASVKQQFQVEMTAAGAAVDGKNVKVTITDAEDDRIAKDISANPANPYIGSSEYFTTEGVKDDTLYASELNSFIIKETGTPAAGKYKVKVTITGDNLTTQYFYVCLVVTDPLAIDQILDAQAMVGDKYRREITARGAADDQSVTWIEVDPAEEKDDLEKTDITNNDDKSVIKKTGLALLGGAARTIAPEMMNDVPQTLTGHSTYLGASITTAEGTTDLSRGKMDAGEWIQGYGVPTAQGKYTITVLAKVAAQNYYAEVGEVVANTDGIGRVYLNKDNIYPAQAATMTFDLNVSKSDKISKTTLYNKGVVGVDADRDNVNIIGNNYEIVGGKAYDRGIVGTLTNSDSQFADYTGYVLKSDTVAYTNDRSYATGAVTYTIDSLSLAPMDLTVELENGADSDFDILLVRTTNAYNVEGDENFVRVGAAAMASKKGVVTIPANGDDDTPTKAYITIVPKEGLAAREEAYTDTIKISGENMLNEIELGISFTVEDAIYQTDAYYWNWAHVGDDGARTDLVIADVPVENAIVELATVVVSAVGSAAEARYLTEEGDRSMMNYVTIKNSGNSPINYLSVEECTENGGTISNSASLLQANGVKKIDLYTFTMQGGEVIAADAQGKPGLERDDTVYFKVVPKKIDSTGIFTAYVKVSFKEKGSDNVHSYVIPVTYWVTDVNRDADSKAKVEPADATVVIEAKEEGYENGSAFRTYAVRNLNDVEDKNAFAHLSVELNNGANFTLSSETADVNGDARLVFDHVPAGGSVEFKVTAKTGLSKLDSYQDTVKVNAYNFQNPKTSNVKFKVEASSKYTVELLDARGTGKNADRYFPENAVLPDIMDYVPVTATTIAPGFTERLYNSFVKGAAAKNNAKIIGVLKNGAQEVQVIDGVSVYVPNGAEVVALDLDGNEKIDTAIMFTMDNGVPAANTPAYAYKCGGAKFELDDVVFALTDEEIAQITRYDQQNHTTTEYFSTIEFKLSTVVYFELADGEVFTEDVLTLKDNANVTLDGYDGVTIASIRGVEIIVPYGKTIASVTGGYMPKAEKAEEAFESWVNDGHYDDVIAVKVDTKINQPHILTPHWHQHQWPGSAVSANQFVKWSWTEDGEGGYKDPVVTIYCTDENCPAADKGERSFSGATTPRVEFDRKDAVPATCLVGASVQYHAKVTYGTNTYEDTIVVDDGKPNGHNYAGTVIWEQEVVSKGIFTNPDKDREIVWHASVSLNCTQCDATTEGHSLTVSGDEVTVSVNIVKEPTCDDVGVKRYTVVSCNVPAGSKFAEFVLTNEAAHELTKESNIPANGHQINFTAESVEHVDDFKTDPEHPTSQVKITCPVCEKVVFEGKVNLVQDPNNKSRWTSNITFENGEVYIFETFDHTEHEWDLVWSWEGTTSQNAVAKAIFTCKIGEEQVVIDGNPVGVVSGNITTYTATVVGPDGETYTDTKAFDENGNDITHEHVWRFDGFDWSKCTSKGGKVTVTYTCTAEKGGEVFTDTIDAKLVKETKTVATYEVSYVGPDGVTKTEKKSYNKETGGEAGGDIEVGNGIFVSGLEEEYTFTGKAIKPAITVWDNDRGVQLAIGTDCTVSYKNNTKLTAGNNKGPAQILIKGKGNYAGKKAYVTFNIVDLDADIDRSEFVEVKKVAVSKDNFTYTGEALYPKTITVTYGNKQTIVLTRGDDPTVADYSGEGSDKVELVFQNNVNKGTANVAVYGSAAKPKAANYAIKAASISGVTGANELGGITWAVKAETPEANLSLGDYDLVLGQDYTMKVTAKTVGTATVKINGKGNFSGKLDASCEVTALELGEENIIVNAFSGKKVKVTVVDNAGNKVAGKFYSFTYAWEGNDLTVTVSATAKANGAIVFTDGEKTVNVGATKLPKMKKSSDYIFNGEALVFDSQEDLAKYVDTKGLELDKDFVIASYQNNNKKGTMKITIQGTGTYGGTQVVSVKIAPKEINNTKAQ
ncbi:MAG: hypothetical protein IKI75_13570 [Lachnospiraceae bacterium]|nr:hypothetical protein [Lachnospiraceae bacterium]